MKNLNNHHQHRLSPSPKKKQVHFPFSLSDSPTKGVSYRKFRKSSNFNSMASIKPYLDSTKNSVIIHYSPGIKYEGTVDENFIPDGMGTFTFSNGEKYEGEVKKGKREGRGRYYYSENTYYDGMWRGDKKHGEGDFVCGNKGWRYIGEWENDNPIKGQFEDYYEENYSLFSDQLSSEIFTNIDNLDEEDSYDDEDEIKRLDSFKDRNSRNSLKSTTYLEEETPKKIKNLSSSSTLMNTDSKPTVSNFDVNNDS